MTLRRPAALNLPPDEPDKPLGPPAESAPTDSASPQIPPARPWSSSGGRVALPPSGVLDWGCTVNLSRKD